VGPLVIQASFHGESAPLAGGAGLVTLVRGSAFALSAGNGDMGGRGTDGLFMLDRRVLSRFQLELDGWPLDHLAVDHLGSANELFVLRESTSAGGTRPLLVTRRREIEGGLIETVTVSNHSEVERRVIVQMKVAADFADLFSVKRGAPEPQMSRIVATGDGICFALDGGTLEVAVTSDQRCGIGQGVLVWSVVLAPAGSWQTRVRVSVRHQGATALPQAPSGDDAAARLLGAPPVLRADDERLATAWRRGTRDLTSLLLADADHPDDSYVAAGAPWFMTLFGRDSLWASWMALPWTTELARGVFATLARHQGRRDDAASEEEPGRILHEVRAIGGSDRIANSEVYYGTIDATPLFVTMVAEAARWGLAADEVRALGPAIDAALDWVLRRTDNGARWLTYDGTGTLENQGWKDSWDAIAMSTGELTSPPIALVEVQAYVYAAFRARADLARWSDDGAAARRWDGAADAWRARFLEAFWIDDRRGLAMAIAGDGSVVDARGSNIGHVLWAGILDQRAASITAAQLVDPALFTGFGVRTLATGMARYDPLSYHNGSVWPHDSGIAVAGLLRHGFAAEAALLIGGLLDASSADDGRFPELFSGLDRSEVGCPVPYPTSCSPQAWSAGTGLLLGRLCSGIEPDVPNGVVRIGTLPFGALGLDLSGVRIGGASCDVRRRGHEVDVAGLPAGIVLARNGERR
jgi:glycogen debranching enzyme